MKLPSFLKAALFSITLSPISLLLAETINPSFSVSGPTMDHCQFVMKNRSAIVSSPAMDNTIVTQSIPTFITIDNSNSTTHDSYLIARDNVSIGEYTTFLNAVAADDPYDLWNETMDASQQNLIIRSGTPGHYHYTAVEEKTNDAITNINWYSAARYCNWCHNGQPVGTEDTTTSSGSYVLNSPYFPPNQLSPGARYFLPTINQFTRAAQYLHTTNNSQASLLQWTSTRTLTDPNTGLFIAYGSTSESENDASHLNEPLDPFTKSSDLTFRIAAPQTTMIAGDIPSMQPSVQPSLQPSAQSHLRVGETNNQITIGQYPDYQPASHPPKQEAKTSFPMRIIGLSLVVLFVIGIAFLSSYSPTTALATLEALPVDTATVDTATVDEIPVVTATVKGSSWIVDGTGALIGRTYF